VRERRLVEGLTHVFSLRSFGAGLRGPRRIRAQRPRRHAAPEDPRAAHRARSHAPPTRPCAPTSCTDRRPCSCSRGALVVSTRRAARSGSARARWPRRGRARSAARSHSAADKPLPARALGRLARPEEVEQPVQGRGRTHVGRSEDVDLSDRTQRGAVRLAPRPRGRESDRRQRPPDRRHPPSHGRRRPVLTSSCSLRPSRVTRAGPGGENAARDEGAGPPRQLLRQPSAELGARAPRNRRRLLPPCARSRTCCSSSPKAFDEIVPLYPPPRPVFRVAEARTCPARIWRRFRDPGDSRGRRRSESLETGGQLTSQLGGRHLFASGAVLTAPQRREVTGIPAPRALARNGAIAVEANGKAGTRGPRSGRALSWLD